MPFDPDDFLKKPDNKSGGFDPDAFLAEDPKDRSTLKNVADTLGYLGRATRTAIAAPFDENVSAGDVWNQVKHLHPENTDKPAVSGGDLLQLLNRVKLPVIGATPDYKGPESVGLTESVLGKRPTSYSELPSGKKIEKTCK